MFSDFVNLEQFDVVPDAFYDSEAARLEGRIGSMSNFRKIRLKPDRYSRALLDDIIRAAKARSR